MKYVECDTWGIRKFMSTFVKRLQQTTCPADSLLQNYKPKYGSGVQFK